MKDNMVWYREDLKQLDVWYSKESATQRMIQWRKTGSDSMYDVWYREDLKWLDVWYRKDLKWLDVWYNEKKQLDATYSEERPEATQCMMYDTVKKDLKRLDVQCMIRWRKTWSDWMLLLLNDWNRLIAMWCSVIVRTSKEYNSKMRIVSRRLCSLTSTSTWMYLKCL